MKKTIPTSIAHTLFYVEEDAYHKLDTYLSEVRKYFASYEDNIEIVQDIESRIQEQLIEASDGTKTHDRIITEAHVDKLIKTMGWPEEFAGESESGASHDHIPKAKRVHKKLYRDTDNAVIGGVASGLASYFGIDPIIIRIAFFISIFFGGLGIIAYLFLWFAVPEAATATQKLEMEGNPVTLDEVKKIIEEKIGEVDGKGKIKSGTDKLGSFISKGFKIFIATFGKVLGAMIKIIALIGTCILVTLLLIAAIDSPFSIGGFVLHSTFLSYMITIIGFLLTVIPFLLLGILGSSISNKKKSDRRQSLVRILGGIWILAVIATAVTTFHIARNQDHYLSLSPENIQEIKVIPITDTSKIIVKNGQRIQIVQGKVPSLEIRGRKHDIERTQIEQNEEALTVSSNPMFESCFLCRTRQAQIVITVSSLSSLSLHNGSSVSFEGTINTLSATIANGSHLTLSGTADSLTVSIENASHLDAENLIASKVAVNIQNGSSADINAKDILSGKLSNASHLEQYGQASTEKVVTENGSRVEKR